MAPRMSVTAEDASRSVSAQVARRWQVIDPLLPWPEAAADAMLTADAGHVLTAEAGRRQLAAGACEHWAGPPDALDLTWGAARRFRLVPQVAGPDVASSLDRLLARWREHLAGVPGAEEADSAAVVTWPSRDIDGVRTLLSRGFAPLAVIAARPTGSHQAMAAAAASRNLATAQPGVSIRRARPADIDLVVRLGLEVIRFDAKVSGVMERPGTADALRHEASSLLAGPEPWVWLAERSGRVIGMLAAERPEAARWIAPLVRAESVAYLLLMGVVADERAGGVGAAMAAQLHREVEAAGVTVTLLHYAQVNPLSAPFWSQQGYRPLWTVWEATPARAFR
jgi:hypothetical protein